MDRTKRFVRIMAPFVACVVCTYVGIFIESGLEQGVSIALQDDKVRERAPDERRPRSDDTLQADLFAVDEHFNRGGFMDALAAEAARRCLSDEDANAPGPDAVHCHLIRDALAIAETRLRIYVYDIPYNFTIGLYKHVLPTFPDMCNNVSWYEVALRHPQYAAELRVHEVMLQSPYRVHDMNEATLFYVPLYSTHLAWCLRPFDQLAGHIRKLYDWLVLHYPQFVNRTSKVRNHIMALTFDAGPRIWPQDVPKDQFIFFGSSKDNSIVIPPCCDFYVQPSMEELKSEGFVPPGRKDIDLFFKGSREAGFRQLFFDHYKGWFNGSRARPIQDLRWPPRPDNLPDFRRATTCFVPQGWPGAEWTGRDTNAIKVGCVPVGFNKTWYSTRFINWSSFTIEIGGMTDDAVDESVRAISKLVRDDTALRRVQRRLHYVMPFTTLVGSVRRAKLGQNRTVMDMMTLFYAELTYWLPRE